MKRFERSSVACSGPDSISLRVESGNAAVKASSWPGERGQARNQDAQWQRFIRDNGTESSITHSLSLAFDVGWRPYGTATADCS